MRGFRHVLRAEGFRLRKSRAMWWSALFLAALSAARVLAAHVSGAIARVPASGGAEVDASGTGWAPFVDGWRTGLSATTLLLLLHAARTISADRESGVLRIALTRASSRGATVIARAVLAIGVVLAGFAATGLGALACALSFFEFGPLIEDGYEFLSAGELHDEIAVAALAALPALVATYAFGLMISAFARSPTVAVAVALSSFLAFDLFKESLGEVQYSVFAAFAPSFVDGSALGEMSSVARGFSDAGYADTLLDLSFFVPCVQTLVFVALACLGASRRAA